MRVSLHLPEQVGLPYEEEEDSANVDEEGGDDGDKGELGLQPVDGEEVEEEGDDGDHTGHLDVEEAGLLLHPGLHQEAAQEGDAQEEEPVKVEDGDDQ